MPLKIIADIGINYNADFRLVEEMIRQCYVGGADVAKFQLYSSQVVFGDDSRRHNEMTFEQAERAKKICDFHEIEFMASVFDEERFEWCEKLGVKSHKIASRTAVHDIPLVEKVVASGKLTYISLGFCAKTKELPMSAYRHSNVKYLRCLSGYPDTFDQYVKYYYYNEFVGFSDHSCGVAFALYNIANGARVIEKHFTLNKGMSGNDHIGSMDLKELKDLREYGDQLYKIRRIAP